MYSYWVNASHHLRVEPPQRCTGCGVYTFHASKFFSEGRLVKVEICCRYCATGTKPVPKIPKEDIEPYISRHPEMLEGLEGLDIKTENLAPEEEWYPDNFRYIL